MNRITEENGDEYTNTKDVLNCQKRFYQNLYDELNVIDDASISLFVLFVLTFYGPVNS